MEHLLFVLLTGILVVRWIVLRNKLLSLEEQIAQLTQRLFRLESEPRVAPVAVHQHTVHQHHDPERSAPKAREQQASPVAPSEPIGMPETKPAFSVPILAPETSTVSPIPPERPRLHLGSQEWEALVGGNWLNRIGALALVIGIALFLGYSFTHMTPPSRALICFTGSFILLAAGIPSRAQANLPHLRQWLNRCRMGCSLCHRLCQLCATSGAPDLESLRWFCSAARCRRRNDRALAPLPCPGAFGCRVFRCLRCACRQPLLFLGPHALVPLAASLLYLGYRFEWNAMPLFGLISTYATCLWQGDLTLSLWTTQSLLLVYWLLFELFDVLRLHRRASGPMVELLFPLNAIAFLALSNHAWSTLASLHVWQSYAFQAALYLVSALTRAFLLPRSDRPSNQDLLTRFRNGGWEASSTLAAALTALAIGRRAVGVWLSPGFAIEAEILYLAGVFLNVAFLRSLGNIGFFISLTRLLTGDIAHDHIITLSDSLALHSWTPTALFHALLFYFNRLLRKSEVTHSSLAAALIAGVLAQELPRHSIGTGWVIFAALLFEAGLYTKLAEFRTHAYFLAVAAVLFDVWQHLFFTPLHAAAPLACALVLLYTLVLHVRFSQPDLPREERLWFDRGSAAAITSLALLLVWQLAPPHYRGLACCVLALVLFELGSLQLPAILARFSYAVMAIAPLLVVFEHSSRFLKPALPEVWLSYAGAALCLFVFAERARKAQYLAGVSASTAAVFFTLSALWLLLPGPTVAPAWATASLVLFFLGIRRNSIEARWQSYIVVIASFCNAWNNDFPLPAAALVIICYLLQFLAPAEGPHIPAGWLGYVEEKPRVFWSLLATVTLSALLWHQFPGGLRTIAWGVEGLLLLAAGFPLRQRVLRLEGLSVLALSILKLFLYDLRNLETMHRILSFIALGLILLGVSWLYTRFRERMGRYL